MRESFSLLDVLYVLFKKIYILIIGLLVGVLLSYSITTFFITPEYTSTMNMYVNNGYTEAAEATGTANAGVITAGTITASVSLVNTYSVLLKDHTFLESVAVSLGNQLSIKQLSSCISYQQVGETEILNISASTPDPQLSADICNTIAALAPDMIKRVTNSGSVQAVGEAVPSARPSSPNMARNIAMGALAGLLIPGFLVVMLSYLDTTVKTEEELKAEHDVPSLGEVPAFKMSAQDKKQYKNHHYSAAYNSIRLNDKTSFQIKEAYKAIRTNVIFSLGTREKNIIEITSASPEEYKSTTSANLAITMAQTGAKVLLIDADMRKSVQHKIFKFENTKGLSNVLAGMAELNECVKQNVMTNLDVFPAGPTPPNPSELLGSKNMEVLLNALEKYYDIILIDTPPISIVTDALALSKYTTGVLLIVRQGKTRHEDVTASLNAAKTAKADIIGTVLVDSDPTKRFGYGNKYYGYYKYSREGYSYSNTEEQETEKQ